MGSVPVLRYGGVPGVAGVETLEAHDLQLQYDRHFHDTYAFGIVLRGVERCKVGRKLNFYGPGTVPMFNRAKCTMAARPRRAFFS